MNHPLPESACLRWHHDFLRLRFLTRWMALLFCSACDEFRG